MKLSIVVLTYARDERVLEMLGHLRPILSGRTDTEVVLVDNNPDTLDRSEILKDIACSRYVKVGSNMGVAGGRNRGVEAARGDVLFFLDDDAFIYPPDFIDRTLAIFEENERAAILAFKSVNYFTNEIIDKEFPHTDKSLKASSEPFRTFRFIGVAHAIRRRLFDEVGLYYDDFFYGAEEFDLSYRAIKGGHEIWYHPEVWVLHKHEAAGRLPGGRAMERTLANKLKVGYLHLPGAIRWLNFAAWSGFALAQSRGKANLMRAYGDFWAWKKLHKNDRQPMNARALAYVRECGGSVWR